MAINVPVGTDMPQKALFFVERPMYPQLLIVGAQRIDDCLPRNAGSLSRGDFGTDQPH